MSQRLTPVFNRMDQCDGKRRYRRRRDAIKAKRQTETAWGGGKLVVYQCPHCAPNWHIGPRAGPGADPRLQGPMVSAYRTATRWHFFAHDCLGCDHPAEAHSLILASEPCLECPCPAYVPLVRPDPSIVRR